MATRTYNLHSLAPVALKQMLLNHPAVPPAEKSVIATVAPGAISGVAAALDAQHEATTGTDAPAADSNSLTVLSGMVASLMGSGQWSKWGDSLATNPIGNLRRRKLRPIKFLVSQVTSDGSGNGTWKWSPQEAFEGFRICVPSGQGAGFVANLIAGDRLMLTQNTRVPINVLRENSDCGKLDFPIVKLGETISASFTGGTANAEMTSVIIGYGERQRTLPDGAEIMYERWHPFDVSTVGASNTATISLQPQRNEILRRIVFDDSTANFANLFVQSITVQDMPQQIGSAAEISAQFFGELAQDDWMDFDMCTLGGLITIGLRNSNTNSVTAQGMALVDVVRLPGEVRR